MRKLWLAAAALSISLLAQSGNPEGYWLGTLDTPGGKLSVAFKVQKAGDAAYKATLDSLTQGAMDIPVDSVTVKDDKVTFVLSKISGRYEGTLKGEEMAGEWSQGGNNLPLNLKRGEAPVFKKGRALTADERDFALSQFEKSKKLFLDSIAGVSDAQWKFKAGPDRWSIADCAEHIAESEKFISEAVTEKIMKAPATAKEAPAAELRARDEKVLATVVDRSHKAQAPEPLKPTGRFPTRDQVVDEFSKRRAKNMDYLRTTQDDLRSHAAPGPGGQPMDAFEYMLLITAHTERHTAQINEVKASDGYPK